MYIDLQNGGSPKITCGTGFATCVYLTMGFTMLYPKTNGSHEQIALHWGYSAFSGTPSYDIVA